MATFKALLTEKQCLLKTKPEFKLDPVTIVVDKKGRVFGSGSAPKPYKLHASWCNYDIDGEGQTSIVAAQAVEDDWGFHFLVKAAFGYLPVTAWMDKNALSGLDGGVLIEPFYVDFFNLNVYVGVRSIGGGLGFDLTSTVGIYVGYALSWGTWYHNPHVALAFDLW